MQKRAMKGPKRKCALCGRVVQGEKTCCGEPTRPAEEVHAEHVQEPWICPVCGADSDTPMTCCGKKAIANPNFKS
jgi:hypothetical protein